MAFLCCANDGSHGLARISALLQPVVCTTCALFWRMRRRGNTSACTILKCPTASISGKSKTGATAEGKGDGQDRPGKSVRLESNDVSKVRTHFSQHRPTASRIDRNQVSVSIGIAIPSAIVLYDLPPDVIVVSGACPIKYFVWEDDIVLVDSCTHEVVEIISGIA